MTRSFVDETRSAANSERFHCCRVSARFCEEWLFLTEKPREVQRSGIHHSENTLGDEQWRGTAERRPFENESAERWRIDALRDDARRFHWTWKQNGGSGKRNYVQIALIQVAVLRGICRAFAL
jgi:hypothetical protein